MAACTTIRKRDDRKARLLVAIVSVAMIWVGPVGLAGDPTGGSSSNEPVHFYSTASPPESFPGPVPESTLDEGDPFAGALPVDTDEEPDAEPTTNPDPDPPGSGPEPVAGVIRASSEGTLDRARADSDPMRLASTAAADRVPIAPDRASGPVASPAEVDPIAAAKAALASCKEQYATVRDYTCTFNKRERIDGRLSGHEIMTMKARTSPASVYFKFKQPNAGREAIFVHGRNGGKAIVHDVGLGRLVAGSVHLDPLGRRAMDGNRHPITEAGIGYMIDTLLEGWHREMNPLDSVVSIRQGVLVNKRPATMIICTHPRKEPHFVFHEVRLYIDQELNLPIRFEAYDWPRRAGEAPPLVEEYTYTDLQLNVGLSDHDFDPSNKTYSFGRF